MEEERISIPAVPSRESINIEFRNVSLSVKEGRKKGFKAILKNVSGSIHSGELTAILGPSGTGKTTLMNILAGFKCRKTRNRQVSGEILVNNQVRNLHVYHKLSCYIMQESQLLSHLSVHESMMVAANLKLSEKIPRTEKFRMINSILENLGIKECQNTKVSCLSGGERKRLCIAQELVSNPPIMFFDEPTSGLDSTSCVQCIALLKTLTTSERIIVCTIHQPSAKVFEMFDNLFILAKGHCIYRGKPENLIPFLSSMNLDCPAYHNPADFVIEVACGEQENCISKLKKAVNRGECAVWSNEHSKSGRMLGYSDGVCNRTLEPDVENGATTDPVCVLSLITESEIVNDIKKIQRKISHQKSFATSFWTQFIVIFLRTLYSILREPMVTHLQILSQVVTALLIGILYFNIGNEATSTLNNSACIFFTVLFLTFASLMPTVLTFPLEMSVLLREHLNRWYSLKAYYLARTTADIPFQITYPIIYCSIMYWMTSQPNDWIRFLTFLSFAMLTTLVGQSLGLLIGAATNVQVAVFLGPCIQIPLLLFSGFFIKFNTIPVYLHWISYISYIRYTFEGMMMSVYGGDREPLNCPEHDCYFKKPQKILEEMDFTNTALYIPFAALVSILFFLRILTYLVLCLKIQSEQ